MNSLLRTVLETIVSLTNDQTLMALLGLNQSCREKVIELMWTHKRCYDLPTWLISPRNPLPRFVHGELTEDAMIVDFRCDRVYDFQPYVEAWPDRKSLG